eukprot:51690-Eustigmatos_ZCMA.PRE.1
MAGAVQSVANVLLILSTLGLYLHASLSYYPGEARMEPAHVRLPPKARLCQRSLSIFTRTSG